MPSTPTRWSAPNGNPASAPDDPSWTLLSVEHETLYRYAQAVEQSHHLACLQPLADAAQRVQRFELEVSPQPQQLRHRLDALGNQRACFAPCRAPRTARSRSQRSVGERSLCHVEPRAGATCSEVRARLGYCANAPFQPASEYLYPSPYVPRLRTFDRVRSAVAQPESSAGRSGHRAHAAHSR